MGNHTDKRAATSDETRFHRCDRIRQQLPLRTDSIPADRTRSNGDHAPSGAGKRPSNCSASCGSSEGNEGCPSGSSPNVRRGTHLDAQDEHGSSDQDRKAMVEMTPSRRCLHLRADTSRCPLPMMFERTPHEEEGRRSACEGVTGRPLTDQRGSVFGRCRPTRNTSDSRGDSGCERAGNRARHGATRRQRYAVVENR